MSLVSQGAINLDDDVCPHLPELTKFEQPFPLRSLLNHSSGIPDYFQFLQCQLGRHEADYVNNDIILQLISRMDTVECPAQTEHRYSNSNYILLATLVQRLSGMTCKEYARKTLFEPLGIQEMTYDDDRFDVIEHRVFSYESDAARSSGYKQHLGNANTVGDGGIYGSTAQLLLWEVDGIASGPTIQACCMQCCNRPPFLMAQCLTIDSDWRLRKDLGKKSCSITAVFGDSTR